MSFVATRVLHAKIATLLIESFFIQPHCEMPWLSEVPQKCAVWHVGCWLPPKECCKSFKVLLKTDLVVASTIRRHWSSKKTDVKALYVAWRHSAPSVKSCFNVSEMWFFQLKWLQLLLQAQKCTQMNYRTVIRRQRGNEHVNAKMTSFWVTSRDHTPPHIRSGS